MTSNDEVKARARRKSVWTYIEWGLVVVLLAIAAINIGPETSLLLAVVTIAVFGTGALIRRSRR